MLVLLIIFMVTAPMMQQGIDVDLPETTTQPLRLRGGAADPHACRRTARPSSARRRSRSAELEREAARRSSRRAATRSSTCARTREAPYGIVVKAMAAARKAGATKLGIVTEPEG